VCTGSTRRVDRSIGPGCAIRASGRPGARGPSFRATWARTAPCPNQP
jgi:hypothetical protein